MKLERAVLRWISDHVNIENLGEQILSASVTKYETTGVGSYTHFHVPSHVAPITGTRCIGGPNIEATGIDGIAMSELSVGEDGRIEMLEIVTHGNQFEDDPGDFQMTGQLLEANKSAHRTG